MTSYPLEPAGEEMAKMGNLVLQRVIDRIDQLPHRWASNPNSAQETDELVKSFLALPSAEPGDLADLLARLDQAADCALETAGPGHLAYIPGSGLFSAALAEFYNRATNRYGGLVSVAPALAALEESVVRWLAREVCGLPESSGGLLTSGGSMATFSAVVAARHDRLGEDTSAGTVYATSFAHHSVAKAARLAGIRREHIRVVPHSPDLRMDTAAAAAMVAADRRAGLSPFLLVGAAGTTDTGTVDPLTALAGLARRENLWFHVDAAYGGFFRLTERGRHRLVGMEDADSITLDPHKSLFMPFGTGALVVRNPALLREAHAGTGDYLQDSGPVGSVPNSADLGLELTHGIRGVRARLPLHLHGVDAFREALNLTVVVFRVRAMHASPEETCRADDLSRKLLERINAYGRAVLSSTMVDCRYTLRICILSHRTHADRIQEVLEIIAREGGRSPNRTTRLLCGVAVTQCIPRLWRGVGMPHGFPCASDGSPTAGPSRGLGGFFFLPAFVQGGIAKERQNAVLQVRD